MMAIPSARSDIVALKAYRAAVQVEDTIRLNANEAPFAGGGCGLNRYPELRPAGLQRRLAELLGVAAPNLLVTRGSSESIDVLIRAWCRAYADNILVTPPTFDMYRVYADIQGVAVAEAPLGREEFELDVDAVLAACTPETKLVFVCNPNNPTGTLVPPGDILQLAEARRGRSLVVVDEAYIEFSGRDSLVHAVPEIPNLVVLRTLSKAHALAGARCGVTIAARAVLDVLDKVLPPYSFPTPVIDSVSDALTESGLASSAASLASLVAERSRVRDRLDALGCVDRTWPSGANFILARFHALAPVLDHLAARRILIRDFGNVPMLQNCARITIGTRTENEALLGALADIGSTANA